MIPGTTESGSHAPHDARNDTPLTGKRRLSRVPKRLILRIGAVLTILLVLAGAGSAWLAIRAEQIRDSLTASAHLLKELQAEFAAGDVSALQQTFNQLQEQTDRARTASTDPLWRAAGLLPGIGPNFSATTEVSVSADDVVNRAVAPLLEVFASTDLELLSPTDGRIDVSPIQRMSPRLATASNTVLLSYQRLSGIDSTGLLPQVSQPLEEAIVSLKRASDALQSASSAAKILPGMLGADRPRNYLLLIQNSAEIRATGGVPGALAVISADDGKVELVAQDNASSMGPFDPAVILDPEQASIFSVRMGRYMQSTNLTPDFPTAAHTAASMWEVRHQNSTIDGVIALDAVALAHILEVTGPVELSFEDPLIGELLARSGLPTALTAANVVPTLLSDVYSAIEDPRLQDPYFAAVAVEIFSVLTSGADSSDGLVQSLIKSADEGRLYVWSVNADEQKVIAVTSLSGSVTGAASGGAAFGAYFNDGTGAKMDYYVRRTAQLNRSCTPEGYLQYTLVATLTNTAPTDAAQSLPAYVTGGGAFGVPEGTVQTNFVGYGPDQSQLQTARINGEPVPLGSYRHGDRPVGVLTTRLSPGQSATVELDFTNVVQHSEPSLDVTPTIQPMSEVVLPLTGNTTCE